MPESERKRNSQKGNEKEDRTGNIHKEDTSYHKLPGNPNNPPDESISTANDSSDGKYSGTNKRDEDIDNDDTRGGR